MSIHVHLERFEGPLGLLLHLIREQEMDIFNININQITRQYLEYIKTMRRLDLEVAGEFVAMAATLLHIKSRMLLPQYNEEGEIVAEDPRKELVDRLLEYEKFKGLAQDLYKRPLLGRNVFARGEVTDVEAEDDGEVQLEDNPLFSLIASYRVAMKNMKKTVHRVSDALQSIASRILELKEFFIVGKRVLFSELIYADGAGRGDQVLVTFLSLLELAKIGFISVFQSEPFADIHIDTKKQIDRDVVSQVESYDAVNAEQKAEEILSKAQLSLDEAILDADEATASEAASETMVADLGASDDEIFAEEARIAAEDGGVVPDDAVELVGAVVEEAAADRITDHLIEDKIHELDFQLSENEAELGEEISQIVVEETVAEESTPAPEYTAAVPEPERDPEVQA